MPLPRLQAMLAMITLDTTNCLRVAHGLCSNRPQSTTLDRDNLPGGVTHLCPRGPVANGLGPDWSEERDAARAGLERVEGADIRRAGLNGPRASNVSLGANGTLIPVT